jgi:photosystem II stability/assembly factor-like uncharacterized protein
MAKRFLYVCAGLFLLALTYHLGVRRADAQAPGNPVVGVVGPNGCNHLAVTANGDSYTTSDQTNWQHTGNVFGADPPAPGNSVIGVAAANSCGNMAVTENGDCFTTGDNGTTWRRSGNVFGAPTAATGTTWGKVKADYRK